MKRVWIVGSGFYGSVVAERIAAEYGLPVTVLERRKHPGGNSWSEMDPESGVECHKYGSHIFHTSDEEVWKYVTRFTGFNSYRHTVLTVFRGEVFTLPVNLGTINQYFRRSMSPGEAMDFVRKLAADAAVVSPSNLEEKAVSQIGRELYEAFFRGYTKKQWEKDPKELSPDIITRLPVRYTYDHRYFSDRYEGIPLSGYGRLLESILEHPLITVHTNCDWREFRDRVSADELVIYTGAIDEFFDYELGHLEWRTVDFEIEHPSCSDFQGTSVMNYADENVSYTRIHEFKHYHPERPDTGKTVIYKEYSRFARRGDEPYYPVFTEENRKLYEKYSELAKVKAPNVVFGGRLGLYRYLDMDDTIAEALSCFRKLEKRIARG